MHAMAVRRPQPDEPQPDEPQPDEPQPDGPMAGGTANRGAGPAGPPDRAPPARPAGPATHALLGHLAAAGFDGAPGCSPPTRRPRR